MSKKFNQQFACSKMMLPEHRGSLQEHKFRIEWEETNRCSLSDEQRHEELQQLLDLATLKQHLLAFTVLCGTGLQTINGVPMRSDPAAGFIYLDSGGGRPKKIRAADVIDIEEL